jgi:hypothetical protein
MPINADSSHTLHTRVVSHLRFFWLRRAALPCELFCLLGGAVQQTIDRDCFCPSCTKYDFKPHCTPSFLLLSITKPLALSLSLCLFERTHLLLAREDIPSRIKAGNQNVETNKTLVRKLFFITLRMIPQRLLLRSWLVLLLVALLSSLAAASNYYNDDYYQDDTTKTDDNNNDNTNTNDDASNNQNRNNGNDDRYDDTYTNYQGDTYATYTGDDAAQSEYVWNQEDDAAASSSSSQYQEDDDLFHWNSNVGFSGVSIMPVSCVN